MVMPSPFERMLQEVGELAAREPDAAFDRLGELYGKSLTDLDVRHLGALAAHIGGTVLGRFDDSAEFIDRCLEHDALDAGEESWRSLQRALAVLHSCRGDDALAQAAYDAGVQNDSDRCRVAIMIVQMLVARRRHKEALEHLDRARELTADLDADDEVIEQVAAIGANVLRFAEGHLRQARSLLRGAAETLGEASRRSADCRQRHLGCYHRGRAALQLGRPAETLAIVQEMMALESAEDADANQRFYSASLACGAQIMRAQFKIAAAALGACQHFAEAVADSERGPLLRIVAELEQELDAAQQAVSGSAATATAAAR